MPHPPARFYSSVTGNRIGVEMTWDDHIVMALGIVTQTSTQSLKIKIKTLSPVVTICAGK